MKIPSPFKLLPSEFPCVAFEAVFDLPDDGISKNQLVVRVDMDSAESGSCDVILIGRTHRETVLGRFTTRIVDLGNVLYGFATIQNCPRLVLK